MTDIYNLPPDVNLDQLEGIQQDYYKLNADQQAKFIKDLTQALNSIDNGTFIVTKTKNLNNPLRFWSAEYRYFLSTIK